jgi:hypothetical protein
MARVFPHWPENQDDRILALPNGHWFFQSIDRFTRTPEPQEISAPVPPADLLRPTEGEIRAEVRRLIVEQENYNRGTHILYRLIAANNNQRLCCIDFDDIPVHAVNHVLIDRLNLHEVSLQWYKL